MPTFEAHPLEHLAGLGVSTQLHLGEHEVAVHRDLENPAGPFDEGDLCVRVTIPNLGRQTGGPGTVVSHDAILDCHLHLDRLPQLGVLLPLEAHKLT
jgi:hypothetical protein